MSRQKIILFSLATVVLVSAISVVLLQTRWDKPLGPQLDLPTYTPGNVRVFPSPSLVASEAASQAGASTPLPGPSPLPNAVSISSPEPLPTPVRQPLCNGPASMTILAIGSDQRSTDYMYGLADSIHIVHIDFTVPKVMVIDFPRDLWVEIPEISDHYGLTSGKLNQAYLFGNPGMGYYDGAGEGPGLLARTLDLNFGLRPDHYLAVNTQTFVKFVDAVGGVDITVDTPIDMSYGIDNPGSDLYLSAGTHHLDGEHALILATNRIPSTFQRMKYQKMILGSLREKLLSPSLLPQIPGLVTRFISSVQTDFTLKEINSLVCISQAVPKENIQADSFPQELFTASTIYDPYRKVYTFIYEADFDRIRSMVADFMLGVWPFP